MERSLIGSESSTPPCASDSAPTTPGTSSVVLQIDEHRNHLAILEAYNFLSDLYSSRSAIQNPEVKRALERSLLRIQFFLMHSDSPILSASDRQALARVRFHHLGQSLDRALELRREISSDSHRE